MTRLNPKNAVPGLDEAIVAGLPPEDVAWPADSAGRVYQLRYDPNGVGG